TKEHAAAGIALTLDKSVASGDEHSITKAGGMTASTSHADEQASGFTGALSSSETRPSSRNNIDTAAITVDNKIHFGSPHGLQTGDAVTYNDPDGDDIGGLENKHTYYVIRVDDNNLKLAATKDDAEAGTAIALNKAVATGTTAYMGNGAVVTVGDSVGVRAKEVIELNSFAGSAAIGAVGIGGSVAIVNIGSQVDAYIGSATITAGADAGDDVTVDAKLVT